jgi:FkbM family methyltransferase
MHPKGGVGYLLSKTRSLSSFYINKNISAILPEVGAVLDVGANIGQFAVAAKKFFPNTPIYSFEPVPETFETLKKNTGPFAEITVYNVALGDSEGTIEFYQNAHSHASSALKVSEEQKAAIPETGHYKAISVKLQKLDNFKFDKPLKRPVLLKLDVQGFEKQVIAGGTEFLKNVDYILIEVSFVRMYEGEPLFDEMHQLLSGLGFVIHSPVGLLTAKDDKILQMDMFYKRVP